MFPTNPQQRYDELHKEFRELESEIESLEKYVQRLQYRLGDKKSELKRVRETIMNNLLADQKKNVKTVLGSLSITTDRTRLVLRDPSKVPPEYFKAQPEYIPELDKAKILEELRVGVIIEGAELEKYDSVRING